MVKKGEKDKALSKGEQSRYRSGVWKTATPDALVKTRNLQTVRDLPMYMTAGTTQEHVKAMERVMIYCLTTRDRGLELRPNAE